MTESISTTIGYISVSIFDGQEEHHCHGNIEDDPEKVDLNHHEVRKGHSVVGLITYDARTGTTCPQCLGSRIIFTAKFDDNAFEVHADNQIACQICSGEGRIGDK